MNYILGDIHGQVNDLKNIVEQIGNKDKDAQFWCVGDYCDRGYDSKGVVDYILSKGDKFKVCKGNHDDVFLCIITGKPTPHSEVKSDEAALVYLDWFYDYGLKETFTSYGKMPEEVKDVLCRKKPLKSITSCIPQSHIDFYSSLPLVLETKDFFVAHAYINPQLKIEYTMGYEEMRRNILWNRFTEEEVKVDKVWGKIGYFGHTPVHTTYHSDNVVFGKDMVLVDTGAVFNRHLSAVCHETKEVFTSKK